MGVSVTEQIVIRNLPDGTKSALRSRAARHRQSVEAEARAILAVALSSEPATINDFLAMPDGAGIEFEPQRLGATARVPEL
jgi:antitoxin FitA